MGTELITTTALIRALGTADMSVNELALRLTGKHTVGGHRDVILGLASLEDQGLVTRVTGRFKATRYRLLMAELLFS